MTLKIAISGKQGSGKTCLADEFVTRYGFERVSFADKLKQTAMDLFGLTWEQVYGDKKERELLQVYGVKMRELDKNVWINSLMRYVDTHEVTNFIVDDVRFQNEFDALKKAGFIMIRINAKEDTRRQRIGENFKSPYHISETDLDGETDWDVVISNEYINVDKYKNLSDKIYKAFTKTEAD